MKFRICLLSGVTPTKTATTKERHQLWRLDAVVLVAIILSSVDLTRFGV